MVLNKLKKNPVKATAQAGAERRLVKAASAAMVASDNAKATAIGKKLADCANDAALTTALSLGELLQVSKALITQNQPQEAYDILVRVYSESAYKKEVKLLSSLVALARKLSLNSDAIAYLEQLVVIAPQEERWKKLLDSMFYVPPFKDPSVVKESYEATWGNTMQSVLKNVNNGESLVSLIMKQHRLGLARGTQVNGPLNASISKHFYKKYGIENTQFGLPLTHVGCVNSRFVLVSDMSLGDLVPRHVTPKTQAIVELGSGWGRNLYYLRLHMGKAGKKLKYFGLEYTDAGVNTCNALKNYDIDIDIHSQHFDYYNPDLSFLNQFEEVVFFSFFSIEQIPLLGDKFFDAMLALKCKFRVVHFEPVGWQRNAEFVQKRLAKDDAFFNALVKRRLDDLEGEDAVMINAALNSRRQSYNIDLIPKLRALEAKGKVIIDDMFYDFSPPVHSVNPGTYISWRPNR